MPDVFPLRHFVLILFFIFPVVGLGQYRAEPIAVDPSQFIEMLKELKSKEGSSPAFIQNANALLDSHGIAYRISFDSATCQKIRDAKLKMKDPSAPLKLGATLQSVDAEGAQLGLPSPNITSDECGGCSIELPLLQLTSKEFIAIVKGRNIKFHLPANFYTEQVVLFDSKDNSTVAKRWPVPFRAKPVGVSYDSNVVYLAFPDPELADLSLAVFTEGVFQIATMKEAEEGGRGRSIPNTAKSPAEQKIKFERWGNTYLLGYREPCSP